MQQVKDRQKLSNLCIDHVTIQSELKFVLQANIVGFKRCESGGRTGPVETV
jgi:hypothetical protein